MSKLAVVRNGHLSPDTTVAQSSQQVSCDLGDEIVVLSLRNGAYYGLDPVAARIWALLAEPRRVAAIRDTLVSEYLGVDPDRCLQEVSSLLVQLASWELVELDPV
jgi:hypothetical protein